MGKKKEKQTFPSQFCIRSVRCEPGAAWVPLREDAVGLRAAELVRRLEQRLDVRGPAAGRARPQGPALAAVWR